MTGPALPSRRSRGSTLIELMIAWTIGLVLMAGAVTVFVESQATLRSNDAVARLQEQARYVFAVIEPDIRMAQFWGLQTDAAAIAHRAGPGDPLSPLAPAGDCGRNWTTDLAHAVAASNSRYPFSCRPYGVAEMVSDTLTIRRASSAIGVSAANALVVHSSRAGPAVLAAGSALPAGFSADTAQTRELVVSAYYVSRNSSLDTSDAPVPSLRRKFLRNSSTGPAIADEEVLPGVEDLQIELGVDTHPPGAPERGTVTRYVNPDDPLLDPSAAGFDPDARIRAVRVWVRLRAEAPETGLPATPAVRYADRDLAPNADGFRRLLVSRTIWLRNAH